MDKNEELQKWLNDDRYVQIAELVELWNLSKSGVSTFLCRSNIKAIKRFVIGRRGRYYFFDKQQCMDARSMLESKMQEIKQLSVDNTVITTKELAMLWGISRDATRAFIYVRRIKPIKNIIVGHGCSAFYDRAECERARPFINQPKKEVEKVDMGKELAIKTITQKQLGQVWGLSSSQVSRLLQENGIRPISEPCRVNEPALYDRAECESIYLIDEPQKQMELPEPREQTPDIIPADTIDLFTMSELEAELKQRGVELTDEVKAKINASDMPEMQEIATIISGNAKTIAIRLSVLNEIARQLISEIKNISEEQKGLFIGALLKNCENADFYLDKELKPCPFCGMNSIVVDCEEISTGYWLARLQCSNCEVKLELDDSTKEIAADLLINQWNERPHDEDCAKTKAGAKSKYNPEFDKIAFDMAAANKTDIEICEQLNISTETFYRYKKEIASFANALNSGRAANPFIITDSQGREKADRYFKLKDFMEMQKQLNDMQKMIEKLVEKLDGVNMTEKKMFVKNGKIDKVVVTETKLEDKK